MVSPRFFLFLVLSSILACTQCSTGQKNRKLLFRNNEFAIYSIQRENLSPKEQKLLPQEFDHPLEISEDKVLDLLGNLRFKKETSYGNITTHVFDEREIREFASDFSDGLRAIKKNQILLVVSKFNPDKSVVSHYYRSGFLVWSEEKTLHLLFGEVRKELEFEEEGSYYDWSRIAEISFENTPESDFIQPHPAFQFKTIEGFRNRRWLVFDKAQLAKLRFEKRKTPDAVVETSVQGDIKSDRKIQRDDDSLLGD